jgi:2-haloacid dehalogenase
MKFSTVVDIVLLCFVCLSASTAAFPAAAGGGEADCSTFDARAIKLVSFDVFAALMDTPGSLLTSVAPILARFGVDGHDPRLQQFVEGMLDGYSGYANHTFSRAETGGDEPFQYVTNTSLVALIHSMQLPIPVDSPSFVDLLACWSQLQPWPGVASTLAVVANAGIQVAPLSNGAAFILKQAWISAFPAIPLHSVFSSDWPVGAFKPQPAMYQQLLTNTGLAPSQVLHVAGAPIDAQGGRQAGVYTALAWNAPLPGLPPCFVLANITSLVQVLKLE